MKIAIISDIHGNREALAALKESHDELWVLGDLVDYGPDPGPVINFVRSHAAVVVRGNHDDAVGLGHDPRCSTPFQRMAAETLAYTLSVLSDDQRSYLAALPLVARRTVGNTKFVLCHAATSDPLYKYIPANSAEWEREIGGTDADVLLVSHTHTPFIQTVGNRTVVNPGSLGQSKTGSPQACYAVWEDGDIVLRAIDYEVERTLEKIDKMAVSLTVREDLKAVLRTGGLAAAAQSLTRKE